MTIAPFTLGAISARYCLQLVFSRTEKGRSLPSSAPAGVRIRRSLRPGRRDQVHRLSRDGAMRSTASTTSTSNTRLSFTGDTI